MREDSCEASEPTTTSDLLEKESSIQDDYNVVRTFDGHLTLRVSGMSGRLPLVINAKRSETVKERNEYLDIVVMTTAW